MDIATQLAEEFRAEHQVTTTDLRHMLHNQLNVRWGQGDRAWKLCQTLRQFVVEHCSPAQLVELMGYAHRHEAKGMKLSSVLGYQGLSDAGQSQSEYLSNLAAAALICRLWDLFDQEYTESLRSRKRA